MPEYLKRLFIFILIVYFPFKIYAMDLEGEARTYFGIRENGENGKVLPVHEYLDLDVNDIGKKNVSFHLGGWLRQDLGEKSFGGEKSDRDLQYGYFSLSDESMNTRFNIGRQFIVDGIISERVDGIYVSSELKNNYSLSTYGGKPAKTGYDGSGNYIYGGRISQGALSRYRIGISYLTERKYNLKLRDEAGVDVWFLPAGKMELSGRSVKNLKKSGWKEHAYYAVLGPFNKLRFIIDSQWINYGDYFSSLPSEAFKLQPDIIDPDEKVLISGGQAEYSLTKNFLLSADYKNYNYKIAGKADYYGGKVKYLVSDKWGAGSDLHRMNSMEDNSGYFESRLYAYRTFVKADMTIDLFDVNYDTQINNVKNAYSGSAALGYKLTKHARLGADLEYSHNPEFNRDVRLFFKFIYGFKAGDKNREKEMD